MIDPRKPDYGNTPVSPRRPRFDYRPAEPGAAPLVSIVTPSFNPSTLLHETAACVFAQSMTQWEWLIVNDCSTDPSSLALLDEYRRRDARIRVIDHEANRGPGAARNTGYAHARCELVFQLDDDDLIEPTTLEKLYWFLLTHPEFAIANGWSVGFGAQEYLWASGFERNENLLHSNSATGRALVRRSAHAHAGGFDESIRGGFEDWDFWLRCANAGLWGATVHEFLDWYRRRDDHADRWSDWDKGDRQSAFAESLKQRYPRLLAGDFPRVERAWPSPGAPIRDELPPLTPLAKEKRRLLLIVPWLTLGGADKFNLDLVEQLHRRGWEVTIATTVRGGDNCWAPEFAKLTPDIFILDRFIQSTDVPAFLRHLIATRRPDAVMVSNSELGYLLLPYLRTFAPQPAYVDFCHSESPAWKDGGYPRYSAAMQDLLDLNIVSSGYLKGYMVRRGAAAEKIETMYTNIDSALWSPCERTRARVRAEHSIAADETVIVFAGRLHPDKQPRVLGGTLRELRERGLRFTALVAGDGPDGRWLTEFVAEHKLERQVRLLGARTSDEVRDLMRASDIFFLPSRWEGIALTAFETMSLGLALVGADVGGQRELVTPDCGVLLPKSTEQGETAAYADALARLIADPAARRAMGWLARERICAQFSLENMGARAVELLALAERRRREGASSALPERLAREAGVQAVEWMRMSRLLDDYWIESQRRVSAADPQAEVIRGLERERDAAWAEARRLSHAWEQHVAHIRQLEARVAEIDRVKDSLWSELQQYRAELERTAADRDQLQRMVAELERHMVYRVLRKTRVLPHV